MKFAYTILYVPDVDAALLFFEQAFGCTRGFLHESGDYGELATGETTLAFASHELAAMNLPSGFIAASATELPLACAVAFVTADVTEAHAAALLAGALEVKAPESKPWGQVVSYVRSPDGMLVELCSPVSA